MHQFGTDLVRSADAAIQLPKAQVAASLERVHLQRLGQRQRLAVVLLGLLAGWGSVVSRDVAMRAQGVPPVGGLLARRRSYQRVSDDLPGVRDPAGCQVRLTQPRRPDGAVRDDATSVR
jgi:hypothetical protein